MCSVPLLTAGIKGSEPNPAPCSEAKGLLVCRSISRSGFQASGCSHEWSKEGLALALRAAIQLRCPHGQSFRCRDGFQQWLKYPNFCYFSLKKEKRYTTKGWILEVTFFCVFDVMNLVIGWYFLTYALDLSYKPQTSMTSVRTEDAQQLAGSGPHSKNLFYLQNFGRKLYTQELGAGQSQCNAWDFEYFLHVFSLESNQGAA